MTTKDQYKDMHIEGDVTPKYGQTIETFDVSFDYIDRRGKQRRAATSHFDVHSAYESFDKNRDSNPVCKRRWIAGFWL